MATDKEQTIISNDTIQPGDLGRLLKEYRESAHLNIDQVSDALCLTPSSIEALESESFDQLPESPYIRGYLRHYARLSDKDPVALIETYDTLRGESSKVEDNTINTGANNSYNDIANPLITPQRFRLALLAALLLLLALLTMIPSVRDWTSNLWSSFSTPSSNTVSNEDNSDTETSLGLPSLTGDVPGNLPIAPEKTEVEIPTEASADDQETQTSEDSNPIDKTAETEEDTSEEKTKDASSETETATTESTENVATEENKPEADDESEDSANDVATEGDTNLKLIFSDEVWIRIKGPNGKTVFEALHPAGTEKELSLTSPLKFKVGNAPGMTLFVNGKEMDITQFTKGSVAKFGIE